ncbi:MAG: hypothetical protein ACLPWF_03745 [Bryobacteraceae bacterium]
MSLAAGSKLGPYEILAPLGAGGMGEVYSRKTRNSIAKSRLKFLPAALAQDPEGLAIESLPAADCLRMSYYEKWYAAVAAPHARTAVLICRRRDA